MRQNGFQMKDHYWHATQMKERKVISWRVKFKASDWSILFCMWRHIFSFDDQRKKWSPARPTFCNRAQRVKNEDKSLIFDKMKWRKSFGTLREYKWSPRVNLVFAASRSSNNKGWICFLSYTYSHKQRNKLNGFKKNHVGSYGIKQMKKQLKSKRMK